MIDGYQVLSTIKSWLDADVDLNDALGTVEGKSKIIIGSFQPEAGSFPLVYLPDLELTPSYMGQVGRVMGKVQFDIQVFANALSDGTEDLEKIYHICSHIDTALSPSVDVSSVFMSQIQLLTALPAMSDNKICRKVLTYTANVREK